MSGGLRARAMAGDAGSMAELTRMPEVSNTLARGGTQGPSAVMPGRALGRRIEIAFASVLILYQLRVCNPPRVNYT